MLNAHVTHEHVHLAPNIPPIDHDQFITTKYQTPRAQLEIHVIRDVTAINKLEINL